MGATDIEPNTNSITTNTANECHIKNNESQNYFNPSNNMPLKPEQSAFFEQNTKLSTLRGYSTIPRAENYESAGNSVCPAIKPEAEESGSNHKTTGKDKTDDSGIHQGCPVHIVSENKDQNPQATKPSNDVWIYPSEQMFFNAMKRKNHNVDEKDMKTVVPIHNAVNEMCWKKILEWESMHKTECGTPRLLRFEGKANDVTLRARLKTLFGYKPPFDRHDWTVDRCGKPVRYIIDFYGGNSKEMTSFYLDVRPAPSFDGVVDILKRWWNPALAENHSNSEITAEGKKRKYNQQMF
ncbi:hypothetical protein BB560_005465 [Smittium megazygosporum]|uniref:Holocytochrome c-type synthase n=1 Tax=Smittium megazygosporum TaxID=133381 RepID=A0A2T9Z542_9FUNG|nr:hypothetical protein BB560_005465 [Smittium megazygosporum]